MRRAWIVAIACVACRGVIGLPSAVSHEGDDAGVQDDASLPPDARLGPDARQRPDAEVVYDAMISVDTRVDLDATPVCGDKIIEAGEQCDDGDAVDTGNGCSSTCQRNDVCGDGKVQSLYEDCDDGDQVDTGNGCSADCQNDAVCGDGQIQSLFETCDDGDAIDTGNGCSAKCQKNAFCGDGFVQSLYETCDDGDQIDEGNGCTGDCQKYGSCGDGIVQSLYEQCDGQPGCDSSCHWECGNGKVDADEVCDWSAPGASSNCRSDCGLYVYAGQSWTFDVGGDGSYVVAAITDVGGNVGAECFDTTGNQIGSIGSSAIPSYGYPQVVEAKTAKIALVYWVTASNAPGGMLIDTSTCSQIAILLNLPSSVDGIDAAMDANGEPTIAMSSGGDLKVYRFAATGGNATATLDYGPCNTYSPIAVAVSPSTNNGVVTCGGTAFRRFSAAGYTDGSPVTRHATATAPVGAVMADDGGFAIIAGDTTDLNFHATFHASTGGVLKDELVGGDYVQAIGGIGVFRQQLTANGFLLGNDGLGEHDLYAEDGTLLGCDVRKSQIRTGYATSYWEYGTDAVIRRNVIDPSRFDLCRAATCGDGSLQSDEGCDDGNLYPDDGCDAYCRKETCGNGRVENGETCDDGNLVAGDGCDATCHLEPQTKPPTTGTLLAGDPTTLLCSPVCDAILDADVARDGTLVLAKQSIDEGYDEVECFAPDHTIRRSKFLVNHPIDHASTHHVLVSSSGKALVFYELEADQTWHAQMLDTPSCTVTAHDFVLPGFQYTSPVNGAMDDTGAFALASEANGISVSRFNYAGGLIATANDPTVSQGGFAIANNRVTGNGVVAFLAGTSAPYTLYFRRFKADGTWLDASKIQVANDTPTNVAVGMNDSGQFVVEWVKSDMSVEAAFYDAGGAAASGILTISGSTGFGYTFGTYGYIHPTLAVKGGANFILGAPHNATSDLYYLYDPSGNQLSSYVFTPFTQYWLSDLAREDDNGITYLLDGNQISYGSLL